MAAVCSKDWTGGFSIAGETVLIVAAFWESEPRRGRPLFSLDAPGNASGISTRSRRRSLPALCFDFLMKKRRDFQNLECAVFGQAKRDKGFVAFLPLINKN